jgi:hypothetical protein
MILSVSRRTDIPNYYSEWFINRIREGYLYVRNPMNPHQISRINLSPQVVDCIVFWTKNPLPIMDRLDEFKEYPFYFQFTLTCYGKDIEPGLPEKNTRMTDIFRLLSSKTGMEKVVWRYDPILFTNKYTPEYHLKAFQEMAEALRGYTEKVVISFVDFYAKSIQNMKRIHVVTLEQSRLLKFASQLSIIAAKNGMKITSCAENMDLTSWGIESGCCIDRALIERITGYITDGPMGSFCVYEDCLYLVSREDQCLYRMDLEENTGEWVKISHNSIDSAYSFCAYDGFIVCIMGLKPSP